MYSKTKTVTSKKYRTWIDELQNKKLYENPENGLDFYNHYKELQSHTSQKMQDSHIIMSIRGLMQSENDSLSELSLFEDITKKQCL